MVRFLSKLRNLLGIEVSDKKIEWDLATRKRALSNFMKIKIDEISDSIQHTLEEYDESYSHSINPSRFLFLILDAFRKASPRHAKTHYRKYSAFYIHFWEALENLATSRILAFSWRYASAMTLLRRSLELLVRGAFFNELAHDVLENRSVKYFPAFRKKIDECIESDESLQKKSKESSVFILELVYDLKLISSELIPNSYDLILNLEKRLLLSSFTQDNIYSLYSDLCKPTHGDLDSTDFRGRLNASVSGFEASYLFSGFKEFLIAYHHVLDFCLVLTFNILMRNLTKSELEKSVRDILGDDEIHFELVETPQFVQMCNGIVSEI